MAIIITTKGNPLCEKYPTTMAGDNKVEKER